MHTDPVMLNRGRILSVAKVAALLRPREYGVWSAELYKPKSKEKDMVLNFSEPAATASAMRPPAPLNSAVAYLSGRLLQGLRAAVPLLGYGLHMNSAGG